jgi:hypothetical protein
VFRQAFFLARYRNMNRAAIPSLFFPAMFHTDSIITVAGLPRMSFKARLLNLAAYFAIVRLLGPRSVGAVYKKHQQDCKGSHDDLLSLRCDGGHYFVRIWAPTDIPSHGDHSGLNRTGARSLCSHSPLSGCDFTPAYESFPRGGNGRSAL